MKENHVDHIARNKDSLVLRSEIIRKIREFFWAKNFLEVETPLILSLPGQEPYLSPMKVEVQDERRKKYQGYLHTSPEYTMKKMLAAGFGDIFSVCKCFRNEESFGGTHNPEFTMIEWYRAGTDFYKIMDDVEELFSVLSRALNKNDYKFERMHMRDLWKKHAGVNLDEYLDKEKMFALCVKKGYKPHLDEKYEDLFYRIFLNEIEPKLVNPTIVYHYPAQMAALARLLEKDDKYAERFEVYVDGLEIANAFSELTDAEEQLQRLKEEQTLRQAQGKDVYEIDMEFIEALKTIPKSAGIALGVDRLVQVLLGGKTLQNIDDVLVLPMSKMF